MNLQFTYCKFSQLLEKVTTIVEIEFKKENPYCTTSFKREFESHWLMEHNKFVCLDSKLSKRIITHQNKNDVH